ncbi:MAG: isochorismatase family protein [Erythrobacter sp.]
MANWHTAFEGHLKPGTSPALLLVDPVAAYIEPESPLYLESGAAAVERMAELATLFRERDLPVIWTGVRYQPGGADGGLFYRKVPVLEIFVGDNPLGDFPASLQPHGDERVVIKQYPSAFFDTGLAERLHEDGIDTLFIGGFSTSGCVRASALDALQYGFAPFVVSDACGDRNADYHGSNLRDLGAKYAEIVTSAEVPALLGA